MEHCNNYLYSVNSLLAYNINEHYYQGTHYVWCSPKFNESQNPPSSNPREIVYALQCDIAGGDRHSRWIEQNRAGLVKGVDAKYNAGIINDLMRDDLFYIITHAEIAHFKPLIYIIDRRKVAKNLIRVPVSETAGLFSQEYIVKELRTAQFDIIELKS